MLLAELLAGPSRTPRAALPSPPRCGALRSPASSPRCSFLLCRPPLVFLEPLPSKDQPG